jgi:hypothetical protein
MEIFNVSVRKLKDGSGSGSFTLPTGFKRADVIPFEDAESCSLCETAPELPMGDADTEFYSLVDLAKQIGEGILRLRILNKKDSGTQPAGL